MSLVPVDTSNEVSVTGYLERARQWLATAVEMTGPEQIAMAKAEIATAAEATKQLGLSKDIQLDAVEMVRRAEYALGKAIRKGQADGTIRQRGEVATANGGFNEVGRQTINFDKASPADFAPKYELTGDHGIYALADDVEPDQLDAAITEAKAEGNLHRANVVRKVKAKAPAATRDSRAVELASLADQGYSSRQIADRIGIGFDAVRRMARDYDIDVPADLVMGKTHRHNGTEIVENTVTALEGLAMGLSLVDYDDIDSNQAAEWAASLKDSLSALNRFHKKIKETAQ